ncbi:MAG: S9 family peptidase [Sphingomonadaceae bacterium]|nr:S9 family peptidase [Sphingomonadaceae bacterium]
MRRLVPAIVSLFMSTSLLAAIPDPVPPVPRLAYPPTRATDLVEDQFGVKVADPYRWLENDVRVDSEVRGWVDAQNQITQDYLKTLPGRDIFAERLKILFDFDRIGTPRKAGNRYFFSRNDGRQNQSVLMVQDGLTGTPRVLIDPNGWAKDGATALAEWHPSGDGRYLVYTVQDGGTDWRIVRVMDVETGEQLGDELRWVKFSNISWTKDNKGFFYSRFAEPDSNAEFQSVNTNQTVFYHQLGTSQAQDRQVYATQDRPLLGHSAQVTDDGQYLLITSSGGTDDRYELTIGSLEQAGSVTKPIRFRPLVPGLNHNWELAGSVGSTFYFLTNKDAPRGRLVAMDVAKPVTLSEIVPQAKATLVGTSLVGDRMILAYLGDARSEVEVRDLKGQPVSMVTLPSIGTAAGFGGKGGDPETFFTFSSFASPPTVYRFDTATGQMEAFFKPKLAFDPADYETSQLFYSSKDGTRIPLYVIKRKGTPAGAPTILYGYGGFNISMTPSFSPTRIAWLEQGGVYAIANLRGGGEYGKEWHDAGRLAQKQNVFDDFIAAGEYLIAEGISGVGKLAIEGRSNGGLLIGAVVNQRPDLFAAALPAVGVMDMLRFNRFTAGRYWVDDYGDPGKAKDFGVLKAYSPYHNIAAGKQYPAILVTTADTDDRVVPGHSFKYTAALQAADLGTKPRLIRIETRAGHGSGKPTDKIVSETADLWSFVAKWTGLDVRPR